MCIFLLQCNYKKIILLKLYYQYLKGIMYFKYMIKRILFMLEYLFKVIFTFTMSSKLVKMNKKFCNCNLKEN